MKTLVAILGSAALLLLGVSAVNAQGTPENPLYFTVKGGIVDPDFGGFDNAVNAGVGIGYDLYADRIGRWSVEGEFTTTISDGEVSGGGDWDADTLALFGVYRGPTFEPGNFYFKGKIGVLDQDIKRAGGAPGTTIPNADDTAAAFGVGAGWRTDRASALEVEYTIMSDELNFFSVGYVRYF
jgi:hypothetical protein